MIAILNLMVVGVLVALGLGIRHVFNVYGDGAGFLACFGIMLCALVHQLWHKKRYGSWFGDERPVITLPDRTPGTPP